MTLEQMANNIEFPIELNYNATTKSIEYSIHEQNYDEYKKESTLVEANNLRYSLESDFKLMLKSSSYNLIKPKIEELFNLLQSLIQKDYDDNIEFYKELENTIRDEFCRRSKK